MLAAAFGDWRLRCRDTYAITARLRAATIVWTVFARATRHASFIVFLFRLFVIFLFRFVFAVGTGVASAASRRQHP